MPGGRPSKYKPEYCDEIIAFFSGPRTEQRVKSITTGKNDYEKTEYETVPCEVPFFSAFARKIGVSEDALLDWCSKHKEFGGAYNTAKKLQQEFLAYNGLAGNYPPASFIFVAKNLTPWRDKNEMELTGKDGGPIPVIMLPPVKK